MSRNEPVQVAAPSLHGLAAEVMAELHGSLVELLSGGGEPIARAVDVERVFKLDKTLSWQVFRLAQSPDLAEAGNVPSRTAVRRLLDAAKRRRIPKPVIERAAAAFEQFENLAAVHGGDRAGLLSMVSGLLGDKSHQYELKIRKSLFRCNAHVWGVHTRTAVRTAIFMPRQIVKDRRIGDFTFVVGDIGLAHRHQNEPLVTHHWLWTHDESSNGSLAGGSNGNGSNGNGAHGHGAAKAGAGLPKYIDHGLEILAEYSTRPLPQMNRDGTMYGTARTELAFPPGLANAVTLYSMQRRENVPSPVDEPFFFQSIFKMPMEAQVWEILVPVGWSNPATARAAIYGCRDKPDQVYEERTADLMPQRETLDYLGVHESVPPLPGEPGHAGAVRHAIEKSGWMGTRYDVYRSRIEYPVMFTMFAARVELAKR